MKVKLWYLATPNLLIMQTPLPLLTIKTDKERRICIYKGMLIHNQEFNRNDKEMVHRECFSSIQILVLGITVERNKQSFQPIESLIRSDLTIFKLFVTSAEKKYLSKSMMDFRFLNNYAL